MCTRGKKSLVELTREWAKQAHFGRKGENFRLREPNFFRKKRQEFWTLFSFFFNRDVRFVHRQVISTFRLFSPRSCFTLKMEIFIFKDENDRKFHNWGTCLDVLVLYFSFYLIYQFIRAINRARRHIFVKLPCVIPAFRRLNRKKTVALRDVKTKKRDGYGR